MKLAQPITIPGSYLNTLRLLFPDAQCAVDDSADIEAQRAQRDGESESAFSERMRALDTALALRPFYHYRTDAGGTQMVEWNWPYSDPLSEQQIRDAIAQNRADAVKAHVEQLLKESTEVALIFFQAGVPFPPEWVTYVKAVKDMVNTPDAEWPTAPAIPTDI